MFKTTKIVKTNEDLISEHCIRNYDGLLAVKDEYKKIASKKYCEKLLNIEFARDMNSLSQVDTVSGVPHLIDKGMVRVSISKMKNAKEAG